LVGKPPRERPKPSQPNAPLARPLVPIILLMASAMSRKLI
jgi:hypothetical protein